MNIIISLILGIVILIVIYDLIKNYKNQSVLQKIKSILLILLASVIILNKLKIIE